jgi:GT2 family glycosyltransferase/peptidoglycan/xylan/chitin deacetylase (PgdA/CDA1 family)
MTADGVKFTIVMPTFQRRDVVTESVRALSRQCNSPPFGVVVVVDGSTDGTAAALQALEPPFGLTVVEQPNLGRAAACNRGAVAAEGEWLLFLDDDMEADPHLLAVHECSHREGADVVVGHVPLHPDSRPGFLTKAVAEWAEGRAMRLGKQGGELGLEDLLTGQMSIRREVFLRIGGFDESFTRDGAYGGEDLDLGRRLLDAGCRIVFEPEAISLQRYVVTPRQNLRQWRDWGRASVLLARSHPDQAEHIFRHRETAFDRVAGRPLRPVFRELVLALATMRLEGPRVTHWFFRVRNLEFFRGTREAGGRPRQRPVRVLCYHAIADLQGASIIEPYGIPPPEFRRQLQLLARHFRFISPDEFARYLRGGGVPRRAVLLTFDDCFRDLFVEALPLLREFRVPALAFAVTGKIGGSYDWDEALGAPRLPLVDGVGLLAAAEHITIGSHTRTHRMLNRLPNDALADEIDGSIADLEALGLPRPQFLAYPYGEHGPAVREVARDAGLLGAFTVEGGRVRPQGERYAIPRAEILRSDTGWRFVWKVLTLRPTRSSKRSYSPIRRVRDRR